ncbi:MAG: hypothetical protein JXB45_12530 [Candidatus Krumholzibacteriota bacterium]|nr:hypothetical protein [Candidatus Krumholzibacteriota bacterium]
MNRQRLNTITILSVPLVMALAVVSYCGAFIPGTYERDSLSLGVQGRGQDLVDLFLVVPVLILSLLFARRRSRKAFHLFGGTVFYVLYSFIIYSFGVHFNYLVLLYCATLGLSLFIFILFMMEMGGMEVEDWYGPVISPRLYGIYLILVALIFYALWLKSIIPALFHHTVPSEAAGYGLPVNPVHVLDLALALPGLMVTAFALMRERRLGYILTPVALVFIVILAVALSGMALMLKREGISEDLSVAVIFIVLAVLSSVLLGGFLRNVQGDERK